MVWINGDAVRSLSSGLSSLSVASCRLLAGVAGPGPGARAEAGADEQWVDDRGAVTSGFSLLVETVPGTSPVLSRKVYCV